MSMEDVYHVYVECSNCGLSDEIDVIKGRTVDSADCLNCRCQTLTRRKFHDVDPENI